MSINEINRKQADHFRQKRTSINNWNGAYRSEKMDRPERLSDKPIDKMRKMMQRMENNIKQHPFQMFDLHEIQENTHLINKNRKFANLLNSLKMYNKKLAEKRELDVVNYKLYQFYYSTLKICNTKTDTEVQFYLRQVDNWFNMYSHKRQLLIYPNKKKQNKKNEEDAIRQTFKSYLPLEIDEYRRKVCLLPSYKQLQEREKAKLNKDKDNDLDGSDDDLKYARDLIDYKQNQQERDKKGKEEIQLPNLRCYRNQMLKMRKTIQQKQQGNILNNLKKNQARILIQSSNNFYQPLRNRNDTFNRNQHAEQQISKKHVEDDNLNGNFKEKSSQDKQAQNNRLIVNSTAMGFYEIKKRNLNMTLGHRKNQASVSEFPRFFMQSGPDFNNNIHQLSYEGKSDHSGNLNNSFTEIQNISGLSLMRNPFQITKGKKEKKSK